MRKFRTFMCECRSTTHLHNSPLRPASPRLLRRAITLSITSQPRLCVAVAPTLLVIGHVNVAKLMMQSLLLPALRCLMRYFVIGYFFQSTISERIFKKCAHLRVVSAAFIVSKLGHSDNNNKTSATA